ncbi:MAG: ABC transporter permease subunit [Bacillota bacterium]|nr:ABC transporter permease subunit [Bacillota bacterium]
MAKTQTELRLKRRPLFPKEDLALHVMAAPGLIYLIIWAYLPMLGLIMAFQNYNARDGIFGSPLCGLANFRFLFASNDAAIITRNTVVYNLVFIFVNMLLAVGLSLMLTELRSRSYAKVTQTIFMLPYFLSWAVVAIVVNAFLHRSDGLVNHFIARMTGRSRPTDWYTVKSIWPPLLVAVNAWKSVGYSAVLYLAVISGISDEYYEAAVLDGASRWQQAKYITIPHLRFIISISIIMAMGNIFRGDFGLFYNVPMNSGRLYEVTDVIDTYIYRSLRVLNNVGMSTAAGLFQSAVGFFTLLLVNQIVRRIDPESSMF